MRFFIRFIFSYVIFIPFHHVFASDFYWEWNGQVFSSGAEACTAAADNLQSIFPTDGPHSFSALQLVNANSSPKQYSCRISYKWGMTSATVYLYGSTTCSDGSVYNSQTGGCDEPEPDPCESTAGQTIKHEYSYTQHDVDGNPTPDPPPVCHDNGCQYTNDFGTFQRRRDPANNDAFLGSFTYKGNGLACTSGNPPPGSVFDQPPSKPPQTDEPKYNQSNDCSEWVTQPDGTLTRSCSSTTEYDQPGPVNCNGTDCTAGTPPTEYSKTDVTAVTDKTTNPDGSTQTETTTTKDTVKCKGSNPCTGTSSETTETSGTNPDGSPGDESTECVGTGCKEEEGEEEEESESRVSYSGKCSDSGPFCEGDAIQCAILNEQYRARCDFEDAGDFPGSKTDIEGLFEGSQFELETSDIQTPSFINSGARFLPASCPPPQQISLTSNGGHTYSLKFDPLCSFASDFSYLIMAMMSIWCAVYVGRAFGGE